MNILDLTSHYFDYLKDNDLEKYIHSNKELFDHYFEYWGHKESFVKTLNNEEVGERKDLILKHIQNIEESFSKKGVNTSNVLIILFVGQKYTNGHSANIGGKFIVFVPIEAYENDDQVLAFLPHEIVHALHYKNVPEFYFNSTDEKEQLGRLLITEGLATYISMKVMSQTKEVALWGGYRSIEEIKIWFDRYADNKKDLKKFALQNFESSDNSLMFYTADKGVVGKDREGYLMGFEVIERIATNGKLSIQNLLTLPRYDFENKVKGYLK